MKNIVSQSIKLNYKNKVFWCFTDEAPSLASYSLIPIVEKFIEKSNLKLDVVDISLANRILSQFPEYLSKNQKVVDTMDLLSKEIENPNISVIKLPNVSASKPQLVSAISELQSKGYNIPDLVQNPLSFDEKENLNKYNNVLGSSVNPVLRQGNSDRRLPDSVKQYAKTNPHQLGEWNKSSGTSVRHMTDGDFYQSELSSIVNKDNQLKIILETEKKALTLKTGISVSKNDVIDVACMSLDKLSNFYKNTFIEAQKNNLLLSLHLKATMMKVSDPIMFGEAIKVYFKNVLNKHSDTLDKLDINLNNGLGSLYNELSKLDIDERNLIMEDLEHQIDIQAKWAYVDSDNGITNLHSPSNVIVDASMPAMIKNSGKMWNKYGKLKDTLAIIPDRMYARIFQKVIDDCKNNGKLDVSTIGSVSNVGLMAKKAEEYGSHDKTFLIPETGKVIVYDQDENILFNQNVNKGDIWRMCITDYQAIINWIKLGIDRVHKTGNPGVFWLDTKREHDKILSEIVKSYVNNIDNIYVKDYIQATDYTLNRMREGNDTISITGNVLRDYLTDLFPILEAGTSAKMLSIVPLMNGGTIYETGAGGTAPKHMEQFLSESHLRWDSIGEYLAISTCLEDIGNKNSDQHLILLGKSLGNAIEKVLANNSNPGRKVGDNDNKTTSYFICLYWAEEMANYDEEFSILFNNLSKNHDKILSELACLGKKINVNGYWKPNPNIVKNILCPSKTLNKLLICK